MVHVVRVPSGAKELITNHTNLMSKVQYILDTYDDELVMKTNRNIWIEGILLVNK